MVKVIELFAGIGAQEQALKEAGIEHRIVATSDIDSYANKVYEALHGEKINLGDIKTIANIKKPYKFIHRFFI